MQMDRSMKMRRGEMGDMLGEAGMIGAGLLATWAGSLIPIPGAGLVAGALVEGALATTWGYGIKENQAAREGALFSVSTRANIGYGQRNVSWDVGEELARSFHREDRSRWSYLPMIGDRFRKDTELYDVYKGELSGGGLKNVNLNDPRAIKQHVEDTRKLLEDYAGLLNTTKEAVHDTLKVLNKFNVTRGNERQQLLEELTKFAKANGITHEAAAQEMFQFAGTAQAAGLNWQAVARDSMAQRSYAAVLQQQGQISAFADPGSLAFQSQQNAAQWAKNTGVGMVAGAGGGWNNIQAWTMMAAHRGKGDPAVGALRLSLGLTHENITQHKAQVDTLRGVLREEGELAALALMSEMQLTPDENRMLWREVETGRNIRHEEALGSYAETVRRTGEGADKVILEHEMTQYVKGRYGKPIFDNRPFSASDEKKLNDLVKKIKPSFFSGDIEPKLNLKVQKYDDDTGNVVPDKEAVDSIRGEGKRLIGEIMKGEIDYDQARNDMYKFVKEMNRFSHEKIETITDLSLSLEYYNVSDEAKDRARIDWDALKKYSVNDLDKKLLKKSSADFKEDRDTYLEIAQRILRGKQTDDDLKIVGDLYALKGDKTLSNILERGGDGTDPAKRAQKENDLKIRFSWDRQNMIDALGTAAYVVDTFGQVQLQEINKKVAQMAKDRGVAEEDLATLFEARVKVKALQEDYKTLFDSERFEEAQKIRYDFAPEEKAAISRAQKSGGLLGSSEWADSLGTLYGGSSMENFLNDTNVFHNLDIEEMSSEPKNADAGTSAIYYLADAIYARAGQTPPARALPPTSESSKNKTGSTPDIQQSPTPTKPSTFVPYLRGGGGLGYA